MNLTQSCVAFYKLDDNAANTSVKDETGNYSGVSARNTNLYHDVGKVIGGLRFNATTDTINLGAKVIGSGADTICAWVYATGWGEGNLGLIVTETTDGPLMGLNLAGTLIYFVGDGFGGTEITTPFTLNEWHHVVASRDATGADGKLYLDGVLKVSGDTGTPQGGTSNTFIGSANGANTFAGLIDNIMIFDKVLSPQEIKKLYNAGRGLNSLSTLETEIEYGFKR